MLNSFKQQCFTMTLWLAFLFTTKSLTPHLKFNTLYRLQNMSNLAACAASTTSSVWLNSWTELYSFVGFQTQSGNESKFPSSFFLNSFNSFSVLNFLSKKSCYSEALCKWSRSDEMQDDCWILFYCWNLWVQKSHMVLSEPSWAYNLQLNIDKIVIL